MKLKLHWQVFIAMFLGVVVGIIFQLIYKTNPSGWLYTMIISLGTIFMRLLRMVIVPLIFTSIVSGVSSIGEGKNIGRLGLKTFLYYICTSIFAILVGLILTNLIHPGSGANIPVSHDFNPGDLKNSGFSGPNFNKNDTSEPDKSCIKWRYARYYFLFDLSWSCVN